MMDCSSDRALESGARGRQRVIMHHQRAKGRNRLDDAREPGRTEARVEPQYVVAERPVDAIAEFDDERSVPGGEEAHFHRFPW